MGPPMTCWPAGSEWTAPPSPGPSVRCGPCSPSEGAPSALTCGCGLWPRSSTISARAGRPASSTVPRSGFAARPPDARTATSSSPAKNKQNAVKSMVVTDSEGHVLWCSPARPASCADITQARQLGLVRLLADGPPVEILADAGYQGLGAQTGGRVVTPPHRKFKKNAPDWYEEMHERQRKAHSSRRIRVEHGIAHLKNWRALARHLGRREHMSDTIQAVAGLLSHQQTVDLKPTRQT
ncbi:transposase family protein [Streptomyces albidoflavus]|uniref:transposase family protein n=2 Tax=Streptomyces albidoflavus TaxID=1886 RepID=UPI0034186633